MSFSEGEPMSNETQGRRPTGPGEYWYDGTYPGDYGPERYEGPVSTGITFAWLTGDEKEYPIDAMPGTFTPLTKPVAELRDERWEPVEKATLMPNDDMGYVMRYADDGTFEVGDAFYILPPDMRICRKGGTQ